MPTVNNPIVSLIKMSVVIQLPRDYNRSIWIKNVNQCVRFHKEGVKYERDMEERLV